MHNLLDFKIVNYPQDAGRSVNIRHVLLLLAVPVLFLGLLLLSGCASDEASCDFFAMDTVMHLSASGERAEEALADAEAEIERLDHLFSISVSDSDIARLNRTGSAVVSAETRQLMECSLELSRITDGAFDITLYPVSELWGFYSDSQQVPEKTELTAALQHVGIEHCHMERDSVTLDAGTKLDLGAIAKGYASARAAEVLQEAGVTSANLSLGGNIHVIGTKPGGSDWTVAIADPKDTNRYAGTLKVRDTAVVTSGGYQRFFEEDGTVYHHILDPETGYPADSGLLSVTIVSEDDTLADALSTALFVMGEEDAVAFWKTAGLAFDMVLITADGRALYSEGLETAFTPDADYASEVIRP